MKRRNFFSFLLALTIATSPTIFAFAEAPDED